MSKNDFQMDTRAGGKRDYLHRVGGLLSAAIFLTGVASVAGVYFGIRGVMEQTWREMGQADFAGHMMMYLVAACCLVSLVKTAIDEKPFSGTLVWCLRIIGGIFLAASILIPRLSGYESSGFELFSSGSFVLIDGWYLLIGLVIIIFSSLIKAGFEMQREMDEIL